MLFSVSRGVRGFWAWCAVVCVTVCALVVGVGVGPVQAQANVGVSSVRAERPGEDQSGATQEGVGEVLDFPGALVAARARGERVEVGAERGFGDVG